MTRHRNVLTRGERLKKLAEEERWTDEQSVFGLPKVSHRNLNVGKKGKKEKEEEPAEGKASQSEEK